MLEFEMTLTICLVAGGEQVDGHTASSNSGFDWSRSDWGEDWFFLVLFIQSQNRGEHKHDINGLDVTSKLESSTLSPQFDNGSGPGPLDQRARPRTALSSQSKPVGDELAWSSISLTSSPSPHSAHAAPISVGPLHLH